MELTEEVLLGQAHQHALKDAMLRAEGVYFGQTPSFRKIGREASSATFLQSLEFPHVRHLAEHPIWTSTSMIKAHFMDEHPIRTSTSMKQRHFIQKGK